MNYYGYLKKRFPLYIISGIIVALLAFSSLALDNYDDHLLTMLNDLDMVSQNKDEVKKQVRDIDAVLDRLKTTYGIEIDSMNNDRQILLALDRLKSGLPDAKITATSFDTQRGQKLLPVEIVMNIESYSRLVSSVSFVESFRLPDYKIKRLLFSESQPGEISLLINGALTMPGAAEETVDEQ